MHGRFEWLTLVQCSYLAQSPFVGRSILGHLMVKGGVNVVRVRLGLYECMVRGEGDGEGGGKGDGDGEGGGAGGVEGDE